MNGFFVALGLAMSSDSSYEYFRSLRFSVDDDEWLISIGRQFSILEEVLLNLRTGVPFVFRSF